MATFLVVVAVFAVLCYLTRRKGGTDRGETPDLDLRLLERGVTVDPQANIDETLATSIEHRFTHSRALDRCRYNLDTQVLELCFRGGAVYRYSGVPEETVRQLCAAQSAGRFFHAYIAGSYSYTPHSPALATTNGVGHQRPLQNSELAQSASSCYTHADTKPVSVDLQGFALFRERVLAVCNHSDAL